MDKYLEDINEMNKNLRKDHEYLDKLFEVLNKIYEYEQEISDLNFDIAYIPYRKEKQIKYLKEIKPRLGKYKGWIIFLSVSIIVFVLSLQGVLTSTSLSIIPDIFLICGGVGILTGSIFWALVIDEDKKEYNIHKDGLKYYDEELEKLKSELEDITKEYQEYIKEASKEQLYDDINKMQDYIYSTEELLKSEEDKRKKIVNELVDSTIGENYINERYEIIEIENRPIIRTKIKENING